MEKYFKKLAADPTRPLALLFSIVMGLAFSVRFYKEPHFIYLLLAFRFWAMSVFLSQRLPPEKPVMFHQRAVAYFSKFIPFFYHGPSPSAPQIFHLISDSLGLTGALLSTWALISLGRRFGVSPARRGEVCRSGAYRWFRHPIYLGYAMVETGAVILNRSNFPLFILSMGTLVLRAHMEDQVLKN